MTAGLRALLTGVIDYAGMFPPAKLSLDEAIRNYCRYRQGPDAWMLGRFICPVGQLGELARYQDELFPSGPPLQVSVVGRGGEKETNFAAGLATDLKEIAAFGTKQGLLVKADVYETRVPSKLLNPQLASELEAWISSATLLIDAHHSGSLTIFYEGNPLSTSSGASDAILLAALKENQSFTASCRAESCRSAGYKLRCGGVVASAFPLTGQVATWIQLAHRAGVPMKFTAGLHHPFRHHDRELNTTMHGFINVFAAGVLTHILGLNEKRAEEIIADEKAENFEFDDKGLRWKEFRASVEEILRARRDAVLSFGSCSFDEPCTDLRALGWIV